MLLSFCIPTYNRCDYLKKNISIIIAQIRENKLENDVEIFVSDNDSPDNTQKVCEEIIVKNPDIHIGYKRNETNIGPDRNYIQVMKMATGMYSILYGDDDFLEPGALARVVEIISKNDCNIYLTNRKCIDGKGKFIGEDIFIDIPSNNMIVDFSNIDSIRSYFYGVKTMGGVLSFISSVVYRTDVLKKYKLDERVMTTHYSYLQYWWTDLFNNGKLFYSNEFLVSATTAAVTNNNNHGTGIKRVALDYEGYSVIADVVFGETPIKQYFLQAVDLDHSDFSLQRMYILNRSEFEKTLVPALKRGGWNPERINSLKKTVTFKSLLVYIKHGYLFPLLGLKK